MSKDQQPAIIIDNVSKLYHKGYGNGIRNQSLKEAFSSAVGLNKAKGGPKLVTSNDFWALKDIDITVEKGEVLGIVGRNGSGKSTLLKLISKVITPTEGSIEVNGKISSLIEVGAGFHSQLTGRENVFFNGAILGMKKKEIKEKIQEIYEFSEIGEFFDTPVKHYSSGMYVRLAFSVAVHVDPDILIIDEVLSVGDFEFRKKSEDKIRSFMGKDKAVLLVSHNANSIQSLCTKAVLINKGLKVTEGDPKEVLATYLSQPK